MKKNQNPETETHTSTIIVASVVVASTTAIAAGVAALRRRTKKDDLGYELVGLFDKLETDYITV